MYFARTGLDAPTRFRQKRNTQKNSTITIHKFDGIALKEPNSIARKTIFRFDVDPILFNEGFNQGNF